MSIRITVEIGPSDDDMDQVLDVDLDELRDVAEANVAGPLQWVWHLGDGSVMRLTVAGDDTPNTGGTTPV